MREYFIHFWFSYKLDKGTHAQPTNTEKSTVGKIHEAV